MNKERWEAVRQFYQEKFGIQPDTVDLFASNDILVLCTSGCSNKSISNTLDIDEESIQDVIELVFDFPGWEKDLDVNGYSIYSYIVNTGNGTFMDFKNEIVHLCPSMKADAVKTLFLICEEYLKISTRLENEWV